MRGPVGFRDADAVIADADTHVAVADGRIDLDDAAVGGVLDRVCEQVGDHLCEPVAVGADDERSPAESSWIV